MPFVIPTYGGGLRNRSLLRWYFACNDLLARDRNRHLDVARHLPRSRQLSRDEFLTLNPLIDSRGVTGGMEWHDYQMYNSDRIVLSFVASAAEAGAVAANYVEADEPLMRRSGLEGVRATDRLSRASLDIHARVVLNAAGPWGPALERRLLPRLPGRLHGRLSKAMNFVIPAPSGVSHALGAEDGGRLFFMVPWRESAIIGTSYDPYDGTADGLSLDSREIETFIEVVNRAFPGLRLGVRDLRLVHRGLVPMSRTGGAGKRAVKSAVVDHRRDGFRGLVSVLGVRYTTARDTAERAIDMVVSQVPRTAGPCRTAVVPLIGGDITAVDDFLRDATAPTEAALSAQTRLRLARTYGTRNRTILDRLAVSRADRVALSANCSVTLGEVRHAVQQEMAVKLSDVVLRRTEAGSAQHPGDEALIAAARIMAGELGWTARRIEEELSEVRRLYRIPGKGAGTGNDLSEHGSTTV